MAGPITTQCPKCKVKLKIKNANAMGKRIPCPKCKQQFVVRPLKKKKKPAPVKDLDPVDALNSFDDDYGSEADFGDDSEFRDDFETEDDHGQSAPSRRRPSGGSSRGRGRNRSGKRRKKKKSSNGLLYIIGSVTALALLILLLFLFWPEGGGGVGIAGANEDRNKIDLSWLPPDTEIVVHVKVDEIWNSALIKELVEDPALAPQIQQLQENFGDETGFSVSQVKSVTFGVAGFTEAQKRQKKLMAGIDLSDPTKFLQDPEQFEKIKTETTEINQSQRMVMVVRCSTEVTAEMLLSKLKQDMQLVENNGNPYYAAGTEERSHRAAFFIADSNTVVAAGERDLVAAIEQGGEDTRRKEFDFVDPDQHLLVAAAPKDPTIFDDDNDVKSQLAQSEALKKYGLESLLKMKKANFNAASFGLTVSSQIDIQLRGDFKGETEAGETKSNYDTVVADLNSKLSETEAKMSEQFPKIMKVARDFMDSFAVNQSGTVLDVTATIPSNIKATQDEIGGLIGFLMLGGLGPPPGQNGQGTQPSLDPNKLPPGLVPNKPGGAGKKNAP